MRANAVAAEPWLIVVGIGEDGAAGLGSDARAALARAEIVVGSERQLRLVQASDAARIAWPTPLAPFVDTLIERHRGRRVVVLASGDPLLHGVGAVFAARLPTRELCVIPTLSAFALACARLCWSETDVVLISAVAKPLARVRRELTPRRRIVVYSESGATPAALAALVRDAGFGSSTMHVFERLGGPAEARRDATARTWNAAACDDLNVVALACVADDDACVYATVPGLPDNAFASDGALTKRDVRAATLARLAPLPGERLWDVGAGSGSIAIEWSRAHPSCRAVAFERDPVRAARIGENAERLGVPDVRVVVGDAPAAFTSARPAGPPDAIFIGGGMNADATLIEACWEALRTGGRIVANVVTVGGESALAAAHARRGGVLVRIAVTHAEPVGGVLGWRAAMPVTQWSAVKP